MRTAYVRVSTVEQNEARQLEALKKYDIEKWFTEKVSGKNMDRPELQKMLEFVREGDTVYVKDFSRLARSTKDLLEIVEKLQAKGVNLVSDKENIDTSTPTGKLLLTVLASINQFERERILENQREGIAIAKAAGKYKGRPKMEYDQEAFKENYDKYMNREITKYQFAINMNISRPTLDRVLKTYQPE